MCSENYLTREKEVGKRRNRKACKVDERDWLAVRRESFDRRQFLKYLDTIFSSDFDWFCLRVGSRRVPPNKLHSCFRQPTLSVLRTVNKCKDIHVCLRVTKDKIRQWKPCQVQVFYSHNLRRGFTLLRWAQIIYFAFQWNKTGPKASHIFYFLSLKNT